MEESNQGKCTFMDRSYDNDAEVCGDETCMVCVNGEWTDASGLFPPKQSGIFSP